MIKDSNHTEEKKSTEVSRPTESIPEERELNPLAEMFYAVKRALLTIPENPSKKNGKPFFRTIAIDNGQFARLVRDRNMEY